jgi:putative membrane protein
VRAITTNSERRKAVVTPPHRAVCKRLPKAAAAVAVAMHPTAAWAHLGRYNRPVEISDWNLDPVLWLNLGLLLLLYVRGLSRIWSRAGIGRVIRPAQVASLLAGVGALAGVLGTPVDALGEQLAWVHMVQHMVLMSVAAPLMVVGAPSIIWLWGISPFWRRTFGRLMRWLESRRIPRRVFWQPVLVWTAYAGIMWIWHIPVLYEAALQNPFVHDIQHLTFFVVACLFWRVVLDPISRFRIGPGAGVLYLFTTTLHATVLGVWMTVAPFPWYATYFGRSELWGLTPLEDQQLAGLIMWMPACLPYLLAALVLVRQCLQDASPQAGAASLPGGRSGTRHPAVGHAAAARRAVRQRLLPVAEITIR